ncbi:MAG: OmpA family protein, partial [Robiginitalea sp.]
MTRRQLIIGMYFLALGTLWAQKDSKGDKFYFQYAYGQAVEAYQQEMRKNGLTQQQQLNLADAYFRTGQYNQSADTFVEIYKRDSLMTNAQFNTMLQALTKTSGKERAMAVLSTRSGQLSGTLMENAEFNLQTLEDAKGSNGTYELFSPNINSVQSDFAPSFYGPDRLLF